MYPFAVCMQSATAAATISGADAFFPLWKTTQYHVPRLPHVCMVYSGATTEGLFWEMKLFLAYSRHLVFCIADRRTKKTFATLGRQIYLLPYS